jgi:hypothetical protein
MLAPSRAMAVIVSSGSIPSAATAGRSNGTKTFAPATRQRHEKKTASVLMNIRKNAEFQSVKKLRAVT